MKKYIRERKNEILVTENNWQTYEVLTRETNQAKEEVNKDKITEVKLRHHYGDSKGKEIINELKSIRKLICEESKNGYGLSYEVFCIGVLYDLEYAEVYEKYIVSGNADGKIDAIYWSDDIVKLYQIKFDVLEGDYRRDINRNYMEYLRNGEISMDNSNDLVRFLMVHRDKLIGKEFKILTISNNDRGSDIKRDEIIDLYFKNKMIPHINNITLSLKVPYIIDSNQNMSILISKSKEEVYAFFCSAKKLIDSLISVDGIWGESSLYKYFYDNVRGYVGENEDMVNTMINEPLNFSKYNNGITITGNVIYHEQAGELIIKSPIISNGQQTVWNLINNKEVIDDVNVLVIVKNDANPSIADKIARYTNTQKNIDAVDLLSLDSSIRNIQAQIFDKQRRKNQFFLDLNTSGIKPYDRVAKKIYGKYGVISLKDFVRIYFSTKDKELGLWKSSISTPIKKLLKNGIPKLNLDKSLKVCQTIKDTYLYLDSIADKNFRNDLRSADVALMYIVFNYNLSLDSASQVIKKINDKYFYNIPQEERGSKLIDLYKSNNIIKMIEEVISK